MQTGRVPEMGSKKERGSRGQRLESALWVRSWLWSWRQTELRGVTCKPKRRPRSCQGPSLATSCSAQLPLGPLPGKEDAVRKSRVKDAFLGLPSAPGRSHCRQSGQPTVHQGDGPRTCTHTPRGACGTPSPPGRSLHLHPHPVWTPQSPVTPRKPLCTNPMPAAPSSYLAASQ